MIHLINSDNWRAMSGLSALGLTIVLIVPGMAIGQSTIPDSLYRDSSPSVIEEETEKEEHNVPNTFKGYNSTDPSAAPSFPVREPEKQASGDVQGVMIDSGTTPGCGEDEDEKSCEKKAGSLTGLSKEEKKLLKGLIGDVVGGSIGVSGGSKNSKSSGQQYFEFIEELEQHEISQADERMAQMLKRWGGAHPDKRLQQALTEFVSPVIAQARRQNLPWRAALTNSSVPNATATMAGQISINPGLIEICNHPAELLGVVFHEVGHVDYRHSLRFLEDEGGLETALKARGSGDDTVVPKLLSRTFDKAYFGYNRVLEGQADEYMLQSFLRLGLDVRKTAGFWAKMLTKFGGTDENIYYSQGTHPASEERMKRILAYASNQPGRTYDPGAEWPGWRTLKAAFPTPPEMETVYLDDGGILVGGKPFDWSLLDRKLGVISADE